jgi:hypothetical protein
MLVFRSYGVTAELVSDEPELLAAARGVLPPGSTASDGPPFVRFGIDARGSVTLETPHGLKYVYRRPDADPIVRLGSIMRHYLALHAHDHIFIKAGVVALDGAAIVIPGGSGSGKTTLVAALIDLGAMYYSDEYAVVDEQGRIHPYAKPLSLRDSARDELGRLEPVLPGRVATQPIAAQLIVSTSYRPDVHWRPERVSAAEAAQLLLTNTPAARTRASSALATACRVARGATGLAGPRGEAGETATALRDQLLRESPSIPTRQRSDALST